MSRAPAFQFYPGDFLVGTLSMTLEQRGAYITLLCFAWEHDGIPTGEREQAVILGIPPGGMARLWVGIQSKWTKRRNRYVNPRMERVRDEQNERRKQQVEAGRKGSEKRWSHGKSDGDPNGNPNGEPIPLLKEVEDEGRDIPWFSEALKRFNEAATRKRVAVDARLIARALRDAPIPVTDPAVKRIAFTCADWLEANAPASGKPRSAHLTLRTFLKDAEPSKPDATANTPPDRQMQVWISNAKRWFGRVPPELVEQIVRDHHKRTGELIQQHELHKLLEEAA